MPSPFPGMNPYLEQPSAWHDFHGSFMEELRRAIAKEVRPRYVVKIDEHVYVHPIGEEDRSFLGRPDGHVVESSDRSTGLGGATTATATIVAPWLATLPTYDEEHVPFIEIRDREHQELVTVVELLSPSNKNAGSDREAYLSKRRVTLKSPTHFIEIDLLRGLPRMPIEGLPDCDYCIMVSRAEQRPEVGIWPFGLRDPLPEIPIPLRAPDPDAAVDLQAALHRVYDAVGYGDFIYRGRPNPLLRAGDAEWAAEIVAGLGK